MRASWAVLNSYTEKTTTVIPAQAGIQECLHYRSTWNWVPACAEKTQEKGAPV